ncbi:hypothetical protein SBA4_5940004 [Candidatus Sulfopaludibacter sp. SbA4]|nr:hypothetical protein SBA4_5940004 [Candidatus Sulfopaludibacter sp. SbA4]
MAAPEIKTAKCGAQAVCWEVVKSAKAAARYHTGQELIAPRPFCSLGKRKGRGAVPYGTGADRAAAVLREFLRRRAEFEPVGEPGTGAGRSLEAAGGEY